MQADVQGAEARKDLGRALAVGSQCGKSPDPAVVLINCSRHITHPAVTEQKNVTNVFTGGRLEQTVADSSITLFAIGIECHQTVLGSVFAYSSQRHDLGQNWHILLAQPYGRVPK